MKLSDVLRYVAMFRALHTNVRHEHNRSPHKFILLYSMCVLYDKGSLKTARIALDDGLLNAWRAECWENWARWVQNEHHQCKFATPFYHMRSEPFWHVKLREETGGEFGTSLRRIRENVEYVEIDDALAVLLRQPETNRLLRDVLLGQLFEIL